MMAKFQDQENILEYIKRFSTVEAPNGTLRNFFHINEFLAPGLTKTQNRLNICAGGYNLIRIYNQLTKKLDLTGDSLIEKIKELCFKTNVKMINLEDEIFPFVEKKLQLDSICESCIDCTKYENELLKDKRPSFNQNH